MDTALEMGKSGLLLLSIDIELDVFPEGKIWNSCWHYIWDFPTKCWILKNEFQPDTWIDIQWNFTYNTDIKYILCFFLIYPKLNILCDSKFWKSNPNLKQWNSMSFGVWIIMDINGALHLWIYESIMYMHSCYPLFCVSSQLGCLKSFTKLERQS